MWTMERLRLGLTRLEGRRTFALAQFFKLIAIDGRDDFILNFLLFVARAAFIFKILGFRGRFRAVRSSRVMVFICHVPSSGKEPRV